MVIVPEGPDDHPIPHTTDSMKCHCNPEIEWCDKSGTPYQFPIVIHSAFDGREVVEKAEEILNETHSK